MFLGLALLGVLGPNVSTAGSDSFRWEDEERYGEWRPKSRIEGVWNVQVEITRCDNGAVLAAFPAMALFAANGTFHDTNASNPATRSDAFGIWKHTGHRKYQFAFRVFNFDPTGLPTGSNIVRHDVVLAPDGKSYTSSGKAELYDVNGILFRTGCSRSTATRFR
jgi:hypothetical protein